jgi:hypothetical protein
MEMPKAKTAVVSADWRDLDGLIGSLRLALKEFGLEMVDHPDYEGTDMLGFIISDQPLTDRDLNEHRLIP